MKPECIAEVAAAIGRQPTAAETKVFEDGLLRQAREIARKEPDTWRSMSAEERLHAMADAATKEALFDAQKQASRKAKNVLAQVRERHAIMARADKLAAQGHNNPIHKALFERLRNADNDITGIRQELLSNVIDALDAVETRFMGLMIDKKSEAAFARAVLDGNTSDPTMTKAAKVLIDEMEKIRLRANAAGADIGQLDYSYIPQPHDTGRIARAGVDEWTKSVMPLLDRSRYMRADGVLMNDAEVMNLLHGAWETLATEGMNKRIAGQATGGSRASRFDDAHRAIHFKDGDSYLSYMNSYGRGSMFDAILGHVGGMAKTIGMMEQLGPNPNATYRLLKDSAEIGDKVKGVYESWDTPATLDMIYDTLNGTTAQPVNPKMASSFQGVRNFTTVVKLQGVLLSSLSDAPLLVQSLVSSGTPVGEAFKTLTNGWGENKRELARELALGMDELTGEIARWHGDHMTQGWTSKLANMTMKLGLVEAWTNGLRRGASLTMSATLNRMRKTDWGDLNAGDLNRLEAGGIDEATWKIWQAAQETGGMLTKNGIRDIPSDVIDTIIDNDLSSIRNQAETEIQKLDSRNQQELEWIKKRKDKYNDAQAEVAVKIAELRKSADKKLQSVADNLQVRADLLLAKIEEVEVKADIDAYIANARTREQIRRQLNAVEDGASSDRIVNKTNITMDVSGRRRGSIGEQLGRRQGNIQRRIVEINKKLRDIEGAENKKIKSVSDGLSKKLSSMQDELDQFIQNSSERTKRRVHVINKISDNVTPAIESARDFAVNQSVAKLLGYIDAESKLAVLSPDISTRASVQQGTNTGTLGGELLRSMMLFKSFPVSIVQKHLRRIRSIPTTGGKSAYSVAMLTNLTLMGAVVIQLKDMIYGKDPRDMTTAKFWTAAFMQGGGIGIFGDLLYTGLGGANRAGQANYQSFAGPVLGTAIDAVDLTLGNVGAALRGEETFFGADSIRFARGNTPFVNLWYVRAAIDHMIIHDLQEQVSPGYLRRMRQRTHKDWGQEYWWDPGEGLPERSPNIEAITGD